jgi:hypothetical protein
LGASAIGSEEEIRALAHEILSRPEYARWHEPTSGLAGLLERLGEGMQALWGRLVEALDAAMPDWLGDALASLWHGLGALLGSGVALPHLPLGRFLLLLVLTVLLIAAIFFLGARLWDAHARARRSRRSADLRPPGEPELLRDAERLAREGRYLDAARRVQLAALELCLERGWLELERSDANRTLRTRLARAPLPPAERHRFGELLGDLERRWFGDRREDPGLYEGWRVLHTRLAALPSRGAA